MSTEEWLRRFKARLIELGHASDLVDDYCVECGPPDSDALEFTPEEAADNTAEFLKPEERL